MRTFSVAGGVVALVASVALVGCGGGGSEPADGGAATSGTSAPAAQAPAAPAAGGLSIPAAMQAFSDDGNVADIAIEGNDLIRFNINRFTVKAGQMVRITLKHVGALPAQAMGHNVVVLQVGDDVFEFGADVGVQGGSAANDYVPESLRNRVVAFTKMIGGGETATVEFQAPGTPGDYPFLCAFPGHFAQMNGNMVVE